MFTYITVQLLIEYGGDLQKVYEYAQSQNVVVCA